MMMDICEEVHPDLPDVECEEAPGPNAFSRFNLDTPDVHVHRGRNADGVHRWE